MEGQKSIFSPNIGNYQMQEPTMSLMPDKTFSSPSWLDKASNAFNNMTPSEQSLMADVGLQFLNQIESANAASRANKMAQIEAVTRPFTGVSVKDLPQQPSVSGGIQNVLMAYRKQKQAEEESKYKQALQRQTNLERKLLSQIGREGLKQQYGKVSPDILATLSEIEKGQ